MPVKLAGKSLQAEKRRRGALVYRELREAGDEGVSYMRLRDVLGSGDVVGPTIIWLRAHGVSIASRPGATTTYVLEEPLPAVWESDEARVAGAVGERMRSERRLEMGRDLPEPGSIGPRRPRARPPELPGQTAAFDAED